MLNTTSKKLRSSLHIKENSEGVHEVCDDRIEHFRSSEDIYFTDKEVKVWEEESGGREADLVALPAPLGSVG